MTGAKGLGDSLLGTVNPILGIGNFLRRAFTGKDKLTRYGINTGKRYFIRHIKGWCLVVILMLHISVVQIKSKLLYTTNSRIPKLVVSISAIKVIFSTGIASMVRR